MNEKNHLIPEVKARLMEILTSIQQEGLARNNKSVVKEESVEDMFAAAMATEIAPLLEELAQAKKEAMEALRDFQNG